MITDKKAVLSLCKRYRYKLERAWTKRTPRKSTIVFIGLNPSTADAVTDD